MNPNLNRQWTSFHCSSYSFLKMTFSFPNLSILAVKSIVTPLLMTSDHLPRPTLVSAVFPLSVGGPPPLSLSQALVFPPM